ncbi:hypothetical protein [Exilibacterium tricleocarpae]|uniref:hypothetical protein n=1 Tax=Exilibacterium tricleocarpae TaxID=2591008 RepID=UPI00115DB55E|nr:hypothetical protein [Exilibacterium tricleocarpae]
MNLTAEDRVPIAKLAQGLPRIKTAGIKTTDTKTTDIKTTDIKTTDIKTTGPKQAFAGSTTSNYHSGF